ncbi:MAG: hypothetical protein NVS2B12_33570 [Ktedonobacteraceae bacterium]
MVGILFVLSGFVTSMPTTSMSSGVASSTTASTSVSRPESGGAASSASSSAGSVAQNNGTPAARGVQPAQAPEYAQAQNTARTQGAPQTSPSEPSVASVLSFLDLGAAGVRIGLGILLFIVGMMGIALGREWRKGVRP